MARWELQAMLIVTKRPLKLGNGIIFEIGTYISREDLELPMDKMPHKVKAMVNVGHLMEIHDADVPEGKWEEIEARAEARESAKEVLEQVFEEPNVAGQPKILELNDDVKYKPVGRYEFPDGKIVKGKEKALEYQASLM